MPALCPPPPISASTYTPPPLLSLPLGKTPPTPADNPIPSNQFTLSSSHHPQNADLRLNPGRFWLRGDPARSAPKPKQTHQELCSRARQRSRSEKYISSERSRQRKVNETVLASCSSAIWPRQSNCLFPSVPFERQWQASHNWLTGRVIIPAPAATTGSDHQRAENGEREDGRRILPWVTAWGRREDRPQASAWAANRERHTVDALHPELLSQVASVLFCMYSRLQVNAKFPDISCTRVMQPFRERGLPSPFSALW